MLKKATLDLIHYGASQYDPSKFLPIGDNHRNKPTGGLWTSPINSEFGWKEWCEGEEFDLGKLTSHFTVRFSGNLLTIDSERDMEKLPWIEPYDRIPGSWIPLFQPLLVCGVDAIYLTLNGLSETRFSATRGLGLYGWDCESVLVMNPKGLFPEEQHHCDDCAIRAEKAA